MWLQKLSNFWKAKTLWNSQKYILDISKLFIQCNTYSCCEHITSGVNIFIWVCQSISPYVCCVSLCLCVWYQIRVLVKKQIMCQNSVNLMSYCIQHTARSFWYYVTEAWYVQLYNIRPKRSSFFLESSFLSVGLKIFYHLPNPPTPHPCTVRCISKHIYICL